MENSTWKKEKSEEDEILKDEDTAILVKQLRVCAKHKDIVRGTRVHAHLLRSGLLKKISPSALKNKQKNKSCFVANAIVSMYAQCGALSRARNFLSGLPARDVYSWNALIAGYAQQGLGEEALNCFEHMIQEGLSPNASTFIWILKACASTGAAAKGEQIHDEISKQGLMVDNIMLGTAVVDMYAKLGALSRAEQAFNELPVRDVVSWNALIAGYAQQGQASNAWSSYELLQEEGLSPDEVTFTCVLKACGSIQGLDKGKQVHDEIFKQRLLGKSSVLCNALVDMYVKCHALAKAQQVLEELPVGNVVLWNNVITGYTQHGKDAEALHCFECMQRMGVAPDVITLTCILKVCGSICVVEKGEKIHCEIVRQRLLGNDFLLGTALVDMYAKSGALSTAQQVFNELQLPTEDVGAWNALLAGYAQYGHFEDALDAFELMQEEGFPPDEVTFTCILKVCGSIGAADKGNQIGDVIDRQRLLEKDDILGSAVVNMYAKLGELARARQVLEELPIGNLSGWNAVMAGYSQHGQVMEALECAQDMELKGFSSNEVSLFYILNACNHSGQVGDGIMLFVMMSNDCDVTPDMEHFTCMVDLFGRAGLLETAVALTQSIPSLDSLAVWSALLSACQRWGHINLGRWAFEHAIQVDKSDVAYYVCMANIYMATGIQEHARKIEAMRVENEAWEKPTSSWLQG